MTDDLHKSLTTARLYEQVVEQLETLIVEGHLIPGDRLPAERELCDQFEVSRTVIREAVKSLQEKGLVEIRPGVGTFVQHGMDKILRQSLGRMTQINQEYGLENLMQVREILEPEIAAIAAEKASPADLDAMWLAIERMNQSLDDIEDFIAADHEFHLALARATQNDLIVNLMDSIVDSLEEQRRLIFSVTGEGPQHGQIHHIRIFKAIQQANRELSRRQMIAHLLQVREDSTTDEI
jgi:GntR family transcriptional regulator, transcriptional repressor for pyruvate dehydrogenase complex